MNTQHEHRAHTHTRTHTYTHCALGWCAGARTKPNDSIIISTIWRHWQFNIRLQNDLYREDPLSYNVSKPLQAKTFKWVVFRMNFSLFHLMSSDSLRVDNFIHCFFPIRSPFYFSIYSIDGTKNLSCYRCKKKCVNSLNVSLTSCVRLKWAPTLFFCAAAVVQQPNLILQRHISEVCDSDKLTKFPGFLFCCSSNFECFVAQEHQVVVCVVLCAVCVCVSLEHHVHFNFKSNLLDLAISSTEKFPKKLFNHMHKYTTRFWNPAIFLSHQFVNNAKQMWTVAKAIFNRINSGEMLHTIYKLQRFRCGMRSMLYNFGILLCLMNDNGISNCKSHHNHTSIVLAHFATEFRV